MMTISIVTHPIESSQINHPVPQFPAKKTPSYQEKAAQLSQQSSSTKDSSCGEVEPQLFTLLANFKSAQGNNRRELECQLIKRLVNMKRNIEGDWFMLDIDWAKKYTEYLYDNSNTLPGPIDNTKILQRKNLIKNKDYYPVNETVWKFLVEEYKGGPEILHDKTPPTPTSNASQDRSKSADISIMSSLSIQPSKITNIPLIGLKNELFYCYMNATLQCLLCISELNDFFSFTLQKIKQHIPKQSYDKLIHCRMYAEFIEQMKTSQNDTLKIGGLRHLMMKRFNPKYQHDGQEFLLYLLSSIDEEIVNLNKEMCKSNNNNNKKNNTNTNTNNIINTNNNEIQFQFPNIIDIQLKGLMQSEIICKNCKGKSMISEEFLTLSLAIQKVSTINQSLEEFLKDEVIQDYRCEKCNKQKNAIKRTKITRLPRYLILHLKRFKYFPKSNKLTQHIKFSMESVFSNTEFKLIGVVVHQGSLEQGHYYSFGKRDHKWQMFNDQRIKQVSKTDVQQQQAYILFYQQN